AMQERMKLDGGDAGAPHERGYVIDDEVVNVAWLHLPRHSHRFEPIRRKLRRVLFPECLAVDAVGESLERDWPVFEVRENERADVGVELDQCGLGEMGSRKERLLQIRDTKDLAFDMKRSLFGVPGLLT